MNKPLRLAFAAVFGAGIGMAANAATLPNIDINRAFGAAKDLGTAATGFTEKEEIELGRELAGRTLGAAPLVNDRPVQAYVNRVGKSLAALSDRPNLPWKFGIIDTMSVNAFAIPGGIILITRGLYQELDNEAQLAAVLGHEITHVTKGHHTSVMRKQAAVSAGAGIGGTVLSARGADRLGIFNQILGEGATLIARGLDRNAEYESDYVGTLLASKGGYSPSGMIDVLHKLHAHAGDPSANLLYETHPHPTERLQYLGDKLAPQMAKLVDGEEPPLQVAVTATTSVPRGKPSVAPAGRALAGDQQPQQQQEQPAAAGGFNPFGGARSGGGSSGGGVGDPSQLLRGIFGR